MLLYIQLQQSFNVYIYIYIATHAKAYECPGVNYNFAKTEGITQAHDNISYVPACHVASYSARRTLDPFQHHAYYTNYISTKYGSFMYAPMQSWYLLHGENIITNFVSHL